MQKTTKIGHILHGHGARSHLGTLYLHQMVHDMFEQLLVSYLEALSCLLNPLFCVRAYKIGYNWLHSATIRHNLAMCVTAEAEPCLKVCFAWLVAAHGTQLNKDTVPVFNFRHMYTIDCFLAL